MSLGTAVLRPQGLSRPPVHGSGRAFDLAVEFFESLMADPAGLEATLLALAGAGGEILPAFLLERKEKMRKAEGRFRKILRPVNSLILEFLGSMGEGIPETLPAALKAMRGLLGLMRKDSAVRMLRDLIDAARTDMDVNGGAVEKVVRDCIGAAAARLEAGVAAGDLSEASVRRFEWGLNLRDFGRLALEELSWPESDADALARALGAIYEAKGWEGILARMARLLDAVESLAGPLGTILEAGVSAKIKAGGSVGAAAAADGAPAAPGAAPAAPICWYASWILRKEVRFEVESGAASIDPIAAVTYNCIAPKGMENLAYHSLWISDLAEHVLHMISIEQKDILSNTLNGAWNLFNCITAWVNKFSLPGWSQWIATTGSSILGGFETMRCSGKDDAVYPLIEILVDGAEAMLYKRWCWIAREFVLSAATLANHDPDKAEEAAKAAAKPYQAKLDELADAERALPTAIDAAAKALLKERRDILYAELSEYRLLARQGNHNQYHGLAYGMGEIGAWVLPLVLAADDRENFGFQKEFLTPAMVGKMFGGMGINLGFRAAAILVGAAMARRFPDDKEGVCFTVLCLANERYLWTPRNDDGGIFAGRFFWLLGNFFIEWAMQVVYLYLAANNSTDEGALAFVKSDPGRKVSFPGFGDPATSPYRLPWKKDDLRQCVQNHMGIWNHYPDKGFIYAVDYDHDAGTDVLASRQGIITDLDSGNPNNGDKKNSIEVMSLVTYTAKARYSMDPVPPPTGTVFTDIDPSLTPPAATDIVDSRFPPYWTVHGKPWPGLPGTLPLHPSASFHPTRKSDFPAGTVAVAFLDPDHDRGLEGRDFSGLKFTNGVDVPAGVVFAPDAPNPPTPVTPMYRAGTTFSPIPSTFTADPFVLKGVPEPARTPAAGLTFYDGEPIPAGVALPPDCLPATMPDHLPLPHPATPLYLPGTMMDKFETNAGGDPEFFNAGTKFVPVGTPNLVIGSSGSADFTWYTPVVFAFMEYQHGLQNFTQISASPASTAGQPESASTDCFDTAVPDLILGRFVEQGRVIMLSGDTGLSMFNHLHVQAHVDSADNGRPNFTIPFVYRDVTHGIRHGLRKSGLPSGVALAMTWYASENPRTTFADAQSLQP